jgi:hypothetical protein
VDPTNLNTCREAAAKCRQEALSSADPEQWIRMAEMWEWLANAMDRMYLLGRDLAQIEEIQKKYDMASEACARRPPPILRGRVALSDKSRDGAISRGRSATSGNPDASAT